MEALKVLEKKIASLVALVHKLKADNAQLAEEKAQLMSESANLKKTVLTDNKQIEKSSKEKALTKSMIDDLIKSVDSLVEQEK